MEDLTLTPQEKKDLEPPKQVLAKAGFYCQQCEKCLRQCPANLDIPALMRSYMYAYGYRNPACARETLELIDLSSPACSRCSICSVKCAMGFDIKDRITDIVRLKDVPTEFLT